MPTRKPNSVPWIGVGLLAVLIGGYAGAYYAMVTPRPSKRIGGGNLPFYHLPGYTGSPKRYVADWELSYRLAPIFDPIHALDRYIRPQVWEP
ncbi:MAG: hypothetical protein IT428_03105 [Planctomycetaceae bacterium]|nr:hypothetical protein [Planctomycetaceae bacterium]